MALPKAAYNWRRRYDPDGTRLADLTRAIVLYVATRAALGLFVWLTGQHFRCYGPRCTDRAMLPDNLLVNGLFQWDAYQYLQLAERGYYVGRDFDTTVPYFPGFPLAAKWVGKLVGSTLAGGIVLNHLASIAGAFLLARLVRRLRVGEPGVASGSIAREASLFWLASPLTLFFSVFLSESLFACLSVLVFWAVVAGAFPVALVAGACACATRNAGLVVAATALLLAFERRHITRVQAVDWLCLALMPIGLLAIMGWQYHALGDPWAWLHAQQRWGRGLVPPWQTLMHDWKGLPGLARRNVDQMYRTQEVLALLLTAPLFAFRKRLRLPWSLWLLGWIEWLLPLASNSLISAARYQSANLYFALAIPALLAPRPTLRGLCWALFGMVLAWYAATYPFGVWAS